MLTYSEYQANQNAQLGRSRILGINLGRQASRFVLRTLQLLKLYPKA